MKDDDKIVLAAVQRDGFALKYASETVKRNPEVVKAAYYNQPGSLQHALVSKKIYVAKGDHDSVSDSITIYATNLSQAHGPFIITEESI